MKIICEREALLQAAQTAAQAVPNRDIKPVLKSLKLSVSDGALTVSATDLELGIRAELRSVDTVEAGDCLVPSRELIAVLRESRCRSVALAAGEEESCTIEGDGFRFELPGEAVGNFPDFPLFPAGDYLEIPAAVLRELIARTAFAAADEAARYSMTGVLFDYKHGVLSLVATDGRRLALACGSCVAVGSEPDHTPVLPSAALEALSRCLSGEQEAVQFHLGTSEACFRTARSEVWTRLVEGRFPAYRSVIPADSHLHAEVSAAEFHAALRQAAVMSSKESPRVRADFAAGLLTLTAQGQGSSRVQLPVSYTGEDFSIHFNPEYLTEMLRVLPGDSSVEVLLKSPTSPALLRVGADYTYLVMPLT